jgi:SP family facilitated glucose transporter-like MFS transporter 1
VDGVGIVAIILQFITIYTPVLFVSRFLMGIFCGFTTGLVPSYILSISPSFISGIIGTFSQISIAIGMAFAYYMGQILGNNDFNDETAIRLFIAIPIICLIAHLVLLCVFPFDNIERLINRRDNLTVRKYLKMVYGKKWRNFEQ